MHQTPGMEQYKSLMGRNVSGKASGQNPTRPKKPPVKAHNPDVTMLRLYTFLARCQACSASPMCIDPNKALKEPIITGEVVPSDVNSGARGRKGGRQVTGQR